MGRNEAGSDALASIEAREIVQRHANNSLYTENRSNLQVRRLVQRFAFSPQVALTIASLAYGEGAQ
jgi:hypothetical protein